ncbi:DUF5681 domain-containing protein [Tabrizicola sp. J26]|uniref:DUF5681 domain-containing protein n=1 Tax=Alitabrizicola rongguiensis TaxID=2909234 RepID=UPI001F1958C5|nr:DUF5681 domain-containing protein [Tabrizicola rongguiensis]MCF1710353.1 DUF5681 domain-containing protein [Tabrizicola rongguiensis]
MSAGKGKNKSMPGTDLETPGFPDGKPGALAVRPGYEVGYAKPPESTRFRKGQSGNPRGRPKGAKNKLPALHEERMKTIILEEAYRSIKVRDGERSVSVPIAQAVLRSLAVNAVKGQHRSQRLFAELLAAVETSNKALHDKWLDTAMEYKIQWERELTRRRSLGITHLPDPLPHPDHIKLDPNAGTIRIVGPSTKEEKAQWDDWMEHKPEFEEEIRELKRLLEDETDPGMRDFLKTDLAQTEKIVHFLNKAERGEL